MFILNFWTQHGIHYKKRYVWYKIVTPIECINVFVIELLHFDHVLSNYYYKYRCYFNSCFVSSLTFFKDLNEDINPPKSSSQVSYPVIPKSSWQLACFDVNYHLAKSSAIRWYWTILIVFYFKLGFFSLFSQLLVKLLVLVQLHKLWKGENQVWNAKETVVS